MDKHIHAKIPAFSVSVWVTVSVSEKVTIVLVWVVQNVVSLRLEFRGRNTVTSGSRRNPKGYDGTRTTSHRMGDLLPEVLAKIGGQYQDRGDLIISAWPSILGPHLASMTQAVAFSSGVLTVKVRNSTLHSLLAVQEKGRLLGELRRRFPHTAIHNIVFKIG